jgi:hypothetical protein
MILQRDAAATNDGNANLVHEIRVASMPRPPPNSSVLLSGHEPKSSDLEEGTTRREPTARSNTCSNQPFPILLTANLRHTAGTDAADHSGPQSRRSDLTRGQKRFRLSA